MLADKPRFYYGDDLFPFVIKAIQKDRPDLQNLFLNIYFSWKTSVIGEMCKINDEFLESQKMFEDNPDNLTLINIQQYFNHEGGQFNCHLERYAKSFIHLPFGTFTEGLAKLLFLHAIKVYREDKGDSLNENQDSNLRYIERKLTDRLEDLKLDEWSIWEVLPEGTKSEVVIQ